MPLSQLTGRFILVADYSNVKLRVLVYLCIMALANQLGVYVMEATKFKAPFLGGEEVPLGNVCQKRGLLGG